MDGLTDWVEVVIGIGEKGYERPYWDCRGEIKDGIGIGEGGIR